MSSMVSQYEIEPELIGLVTDLARGDTSLDRTPEHVAELIAEQAAANREGRGLLAFGVAAHVAGLERPGLSDLAVTLFSIMLAAYVTRVDEVTFTQTWAYALPDVRTVHAFGTAISQLREHGAWAWDQEET